MTAEQDLWLDELSRLSQEYGGYDFNQDEDDDMLSDFADSKVTVNKKELLSAIKANLETHRQTFIKAQEGYRAEVIKVLDRTLQEMRDGRPFVAHNIIGLVTPSDHTKDYVRVIKMLEMCTDDQIVVTEKQFNQFVLDDWGWKGEFIATSSRYSG